MKNMCKDGLSDDLWQMPDELQWAWHELQSVPSYVEQQARQFATEGDLPWPLPRVDLEVHSSKLA